MPRVQVVFYKDKTRVRVLEWLRNVHRGNFGEYARAVARIELLAERGDELQPPWSEPLGAGLHQLRMSADQGRVRILYFLHLDELAVLTSVIRTADRVPMHAIVRANRRRRSFQLKIEAHTHAEAV